MVGGALTKLVVVPSSRRADVVVAPLQGEKAQPPQGASTTEFFVDCGHGDDTAAGTSAAAPFATLRAARDAARRVTTVSSTIVNVVGGQVCRSWQNADDTTQQNASLQLDLRDSNTAWRAIGGAPVVLSGGVPVNTSQWKRLTPEQRTLFKPAVADKIVSLDLHSLVDDVGRLTYLEIAAGNACIRTDLYVDSGVELVHAPPAGGSAVVGRKLVLARYPNLIEPPVTSNWLGVRNPDSKQNAITVDASAEQLKAWSAQLAESGQIFAHGLWAYNWADTHRKVLNASRTADGGRLILERQPTGATADANLDKAQVKGQQGGHAYLYNAHFEVDQAGEYSIDHVSGTLYFLPPPDSVTASAIGSFELSVARTLLSVLDAHNITFSGFEFRGSRGAGVVIDHSTNIVLANGSISDSGSQVCCNPTIWIANEDGTP